MCAPNECHASRKSFNERPSAYGVIIRGNRMLIVDLGDFDTAYENNGFNLYFTTCYSVRTFLDWRFNGARFFPQMCIPFICNILRYDGPGSGVTPIANI